MEMAKELLRADLGFDETDEPNESDEPDEEPEVDTCLSVETHSFQIVALSHVNVNIKSTPTLILSNVAHAFSVYKQIKSFHSLG